MANCPWCHGVLFLTDEERFRVMAKPNDNYDLEKKDCPRCGATVELKLEIVARKPIQEWES